MILRRPVLSALTSIRTLGESKRSMDKRISHAETMGDSGKDPWRSARGAALDEQKLHLKKCVEDFADKHSSEIEYVEKLIGNAAY